MVHHVTQRSLESLDAFRFSPIFLKFPAPTFPVGCTGAQVVKLSVKHGETGPDVLKLDKRTDFFHLQFL
jgi:hypothetical protein